MHGEEYLHGHAMIQKSHFVSASKALADVAVLAPAPSTARLPAELGDIDHADGPYSSPVGNDSTGDVAVGQSAINATSSVGESSANHGKTSPFEASANSLIDHGSVVYSFLKDCRQTPASYVALQIVELLRAQAIAWIATFVCLGCFGFWVFRLGDHDLIRKVFPVGTAACLCHVSSILSQKLGEPWSRFSPTTAMITAILVMEMGSFERFVIKTTFRGVGTLFGGMLAVVCAEVSSLVGHFNVVLLGVCFVVFTFDAVMTRRHKDVAYFFTMVSVTFALVFFSYLQEGWRVVWARLSSVMFGVLIAVVSFVSFAFASGEWQSSKSACVILQKSEQLLHKVMIAIDFAFGRNLINSIRDMESLAGIQSKDVQEYFHVDEGDDLEEMRSLVAEGVFASLPIDFETSALLGECRSAWADMQLVRSVLSWICPRLFSYEIPNVGLLCDRSHPLYVQASAFAHSAPVDPDMWRSKGAKLEAVRTQIQKTQEPWARVFKLQIRTLSHKRTIFETAHKLQESFLEGFQDIASALSAANDSLTSARRAMNADFSAHREQMWRFDSFCQSLDIIIAELSSLALLMMKIYQIKEAADGKIWNTLTGLSCMSSHDPDQVVAPVQPKDIRSVFKELTQPFTPAGKKRLSITVDNDDGE